VSKGERRRERVREGGEGLKGSRRSKRERVNEREE